MEGVHHHSTIAQLRQRLVLEYEAAHNGLHGLAAVGKAPHLYRTECTERISEVHQRLIDIVGPDEATRIVA